jgi:hypothetical protein
MRIVLSSSAAVRLDAARQFVLDSPPAAEVLVVGATRGAADDLVRALAGARGATFGLYRFSLTQLAARLAAPLLAADRLSPATALGIGPWRRVRCADSEQHSATSVGRLVARFPARWHAPGGTGLAGVPAASTAPARGTGWPPCYSGSTSSSPPHRRWTARRSCAQPRQRPLRTGAFANCRLLLLDRGQQRRRARVRRCPVRRAPAAAATVPAATDRQARSRR